MTILRFSPMVARWVASSGTTTQTQASTGALTFSTCLPLRVLATHSSSGTTKPSPSVEARSRLVPGTCTNSETIESAASRSHIRRTGSPWPRPPGSLPTSSVKNLPEEENSITLSVDMACKVNSPLSPSL